MQGDVFAPADTHAELQAFQAIEPPYAFPIHHPSFSSQQHPDPQNAKARSRVGELTDAETQRRLIRSSRGSIPRGTTEVGQLTGPLHADAVGRLKPRSQLASADGPQA